MTPEKLIKLLASLVALATLAACDNSQNSQSGEPGDEKVPQLVYVTNGVDPFWNIAENGALKAAEEFNAEVEVFMPPSASIEDQKRFLETKLITGVDGIAISPIKPEAQNPDLKKYAEQTILSTHDSDAPDSNRQFFVGMDNYKAGRAAGKLVKEVLPDGGKIMIFVGRLEQLNARQRRQGVIDEVLDLPMQSVNDLEVTPNGSPVQNDKYVILDTRTDEFDFARAKANAEDAINAYPELNCMVGLFAYNIPNCLQAVKQAGKVGDIKLVSFDENDMTLEGIKNGEVFGTISQQPYEYGYHSIRILASLARGDKSALPENNYLEIPIVVVRKDNVVPFHEKVVELRKSPSVN